MIEMLKNDIRSFKAIDLVVAVITGVVAWAYMLAGSPIINNVLHSIGPIGYFLAAFLLSILYILLTLGYSIRKSGLVILVAMLVQATMRLITGDPFGFIALQAYIIGGPIIWLITAGFKNTEKNMFAKWLLIGFMCHFFVDGLFYIYLGVTPIFGSMLLGYLWAYVGASLITGIGVGVGHVSLYKWISKSKAINQIYILDKAARLDH